MHAKRHELTLFTGHGPFPAVILIAFIVAIGGCASPPTFQPASGSERFPPYEGEVIVLENLPPSDQYIPVGIVSIEGVLLTKEADMVKKIKAKAADKGANAVVMQSAMKVIKDPDGNTTRRLAAWAIRVQR